MKKFIDWVENDGGFLVIIYGVGFIVFIIAMLFIK